MKVLQRYNENYHELSVEATAQKIRVVRLEGNRQVERSIDFYNLELIKQGAGKQVRFTMLQKMAQSQLELLKNSHTEQEFRKLEGNTPYVLGE